jgi:pimeloyl-ACP methyl ester carboxylesterase
MSGSDTTAPLAPFEGRVPPAPAWFGAALAQRPERRHHAVDGVAIETLTWGDIGRPGLLLLHGKMAHADWWSFIAPFFAARYRVAALSFAGMGGSGWRSKYTVENMASEVSGIVREAGLLENAAKPLLVGHSFGGFVGLRCAAEFGAELGGVCIIDSPLLSREQRQARIERARADPAALTPNAIRGVFSSRPTRVYDSLPAALARFRFAPPQPCENPFIADHIARTALKQLPEGGWTWRFDPQVAEIHPGNAAQHLRDAACPLAHLWGAESALVTPEVAAYINSLCPAGTPQFEIPAARHHVMVDQPLALVCALRGLLARWPEGQP